MNNFRDEKQTKQRPPQLHVGASTTAQAAKMYHAGDGAKVTERNNSSEGVLPALRKGLLRCYYYYRVLCGIQYKQ